MPGKCAKGKVRSPSGRCIIRGGAAYRKYFGSPAKRSRRRRSRKRTPSRRSRRRAPARRSRRSLRSRRRAPAKSSRRRASREQYPGGPYGVNNFFDKIYIINLADKTERWKKVSGRFERNHVKFSKFTAIDGRCQTEAECKKKRLALMKKYDVRMRLGEYPLKELVPVASLTLGTMLMLKEMVRNSWERMLVCEDDIVFDRGFHSKFKAGAKELEEYLPDWDLLYLGCGNFCGHRGISKRRTERNVHLSSLTRFTGEKMYSLHKYDLRQPCGDCPSVSAHLSRPAMPGGGWAYAYSLKGAKKMLKIMGKQVGEHIDGLLWDGVMDGVFIAAAFDPPIVWHEYGAARLDSSLPWEW